MNLCSNLTQPQRNGTNLIAIMVKVPYRLTKGASSSTVGLVGLTAGVAGI